MTEKPSDLEKGAEGRKPAEDTAAFSVSPEPEPPAAPTGQKQRDALGRYLPQHLENVTNGLNTDRLPPRLEFIQREVERFDAGQLVDEGTEETEIPTRRRSRLRYRTFIHRQILGVAAALEHKGIYDRHGKMRLSWLGKIESLINTAIRIDASLAPDRSAKQAVDLQTWIEERGQGEDPSPE